MYAKVGPLWLASITSPGPATSMSATYSPIFLLEESLHVSVCLQMAVRLDPAVTWMILLDGVVGLGGPLHARLLELTSV